jgi:hypothetical protein
LAMVYTLTAVRRVGSGTGQPVVARS